MAEHVAPVRLPAFGGPAGPALDEVLTVRRSLRRFAPGAMPLEDLAALCFAAQGVTHARGYRTAASAGALYPLELFAAVGEVTGLAPGVWRYSPYTHLLAPSVPGDRRGELARACLDQSWMAQAQVLLVFCAVFSRVTGKYGQRGERYVHMEAGIAAQNVCLLAVARGHGACVVGAFADDLVRGLVGAAPDEVPLLVLPVGRKG